MSFTDSDELFESSLAPAAAPAVAAALEDLFGVVPANKLRDGKANPRMIAAGFHEPFLVR